METLRFFRYARNEKMTILNSCKLITDVCLEQSVSVMDLGMWIMVFGMRDTSDAE